MSDSSIIHTRTHITELADLEKFPPQLIDSIVEFTHGILRDELKHCSNIALAVDSLRGNEKVISNAILDRIK